jgi:hypothetical protein
MLPLLSDPEIILPEFHIHSGLASGGLFGGNVLATRGEMSGDGSYSEAVDGLGVTGLRYPGGSLTEEHFDITNPDAITAISAKTGATSKIIPISEFLSFAGENGHAVTIVLPTWDQLTQTYDANGDREAAVQEDELREFVHDVASGVYGFSEIEAFEVGNEYWGSGKMNAVEYGRLSSEMALIIKDELRIVSETYGIDTSNTGVLVQSGCNFGTSKISTEYVGWDSHAVIDDLLDQHPGANISYNNIRGNGTVNWSEINNELIIMSFDTPEKMAAVHGIVGHVYTYGISKEDAGDYHLHSIEQSWLTKEGFENAEIHITEWNMKSSSVLDRTEDYGLFQAHEMLHIVDNFIDAGVDAAHVWPLIQNTSNPLSAGMDYSGRTAPGEIFSMMSENLPGKAIVDFTPNDNRSTEYDAGAVDVHAYAGKGDMLLYIASTLDETTITDVDLSNFVAGFDSMEISVLGVAPGQNPGDTRSDVEVQRLDASEVYRDGILEADLDRGEIMQVVIRGIKPTDAFAPTLAAIDADDDMSDEPHLATMDQAFRAQVEQVDIVLFDEQEAATAEAAPVEVASAEDVETTVWDQPSPMRARAVAEPNDAEIMIEDTQHLDKEEEEADGSDGLAGLGFLLGLAPLLALLGVA